MGNFLPTALLAIGIMGLVILGLAIGLLVTGKPRLHHGCGKKVGGTSRCHCSCPKKKRESSDDT